MECNKDEAFRAKTIAEKKLVDKDYAGAKKFILKAQTLYPGLDGISQMLTTLEVYIAAANKVSGEVDWYAILGVNPADDDETIRKNYRKLALMLHPDKNKSVGAEGAFKLLSEAWSLLSDKSKRLAYNQRRSTKVFHQKASSKSGGPSAASDVNGLNSFAKRATSKPNSRTSTTTTTTTTTTTRMAPASVPVPPVGHPPPPPVVTDRNDTFWTICHRCKMHYEYLNLYLNHTLLCPNCHEPFLATEMPPPVNLPMPAKPSFHQRHPNPSNHAPSSKSTSKQYNPGRSTAGTRDSGGPPPVLHSYDNANANCGPSLRTNVSCNTDPSIASKAASVVQQVNERLKKEREEFYAGWPSKKRKPDEDGLKFPFQMSTGNVSAGDGNLSGLRKTGFVTDRGYTFSSMDNKVNRTRELTLLETRKMLIHKAQTEICRKISEWNTEEKSTGKQVTEKKKVSETADEKEREELVMHVSDPDFHDFDLDRTENSFEDNQVWAAYDDDDGMPRFYALIHKVLSRKPLKLKLSWLNSKTTTEFGSSEWISYGFRKTCGAFRIGRHELYKSLNSFSQKVLWKKSSRGSVLIFPGKGEVWALYRNWSPDWNENIPDDVIHKYDMVEVVHDYDEEKGIRVSPLVKHSGFKTVFHPRTDQSEVKLIPKEEMFRFSHQVPKYLLTGNEAQNSPKGCLELDPAATPLDLIEEARDAKKDNGEETRQI